MTNNAANFVCVRHDERLDMRMTMMTTPKTVSTLNDKSHDWLKGVARPPSGGEAAAPPASILPKHTRL